jgi:quinol monooxygenase YgiN
MNAIAFDPRATTLINVLACDPANQAALVDLLRQNTDEVITTLDGWRSTSFVAAQDGTHVVIISQWRDAAAVGAMQGDARMQAYFPRIVALASLDSVIGAVAYARHA